MSKKKYVYIAEFEFNVNDKVKTPFTKHGIVTMIAIDSSGYNYYVENNAPGIVNKWFRSLDLKLRK